MADTTGKPGACRAWPQPESREGSRVAGSAEKREQRRYWLEQRRSLAPEAREAENELLCAALAGWEFYRSAKTVGLYLHVRDEVDIDAIAEDAWRSGKRAVVPRIVQGNAGTMEMRTIRNWGEVAEGDFGMREPVAPTPAVAAADIDLWLVPGVAFTEQGARLGYGGGYYDRLLAQARPDAILAGIAYEQQIAPLLPADPWDVTVMFVVTPKRVIDCRASS